MIPVLLPYAMSPMHPSIIAVSATCSWVGLIADSAFFNGFNSSNSALQLKFPDSKIAPPCTACRLYSACVS